MIKVFCDRCGKIMANDDPLIAEVKIETAADLECYDICRSCRLKLQGWIENAEDNDTGEAAESE